MKVHGPCVAVGIVDEKRDSVGCGVVGAGKELAIAVFTDLDHSRDWILVLNNGQPEHHRRVVARRYDPDRRTWEVIGTPTLGWKTSRRKSETPAAAAGSASEADAPP